MPAMMKYRLLLVSFLVFFQCFSAGAEDEPCLLQKPAIKEGRVPLCRTPEEAGDANAYVLIDEEAHLLRLRLYWAEKEVWWEYTRQYDWGCEVSVRAEARQDGGEAGSFLYDWQFRCQSRSPQAMRGAVVQWMEPQENPVNPALKEVGLHPVVAEWLRNPPKMEWKQWSNRPDADGICPPLAVPGETWHQQAASAWLPGPGFCRASGSTDHCIYPAPSNPYRESYGDEQPPCFDRDGVLYESKDFDRVFFFTRHDGYVKGVTLVPKYDPAVEAPLLLAQIEQDLPFFEEACWVSSADILVPLQEGLRRALALYEGDNPEEKQVTAALQSLRSAAESLFEEKQMKSEGWDVIRCAVDHLLARGNS